MTSSDWESRVPPTRLLPPFPLTCLDLGLHPKCSTPALPISTMTRRTRKSDQHLLETSIRKSNISACVLDMLSTSEKGLDVIKKKKRKQHHLIHPNSSCPPTSPTPPGKRAHLALNPTTLSQWYAVLEDSSNTFS